MAKRPQAPLDPRGAQDVEMGAVNEGHEGSLIDPDSERSSKEKTKPGLNYRARLLTSTRAILAAARFQLMSKSQEETENSEPEEKSRSSVRMRHAALAKQLNAYGVLLILLAGATSVAILQPPGSFDADGHIRTTPLVACYLLFASLSFLLACTGLYAVMAGTDTLFDPVFYAAPVHDQSVDIRTPKDILATPKDILATSKEIKIIDDNICRVKRLKTYLGFSLLFCMVAFALGAFAVLGPGPRNRWMAIGTMVFGVTVLSFEGLLTLRSPSFKAEKRWLTRLRKIIYL